MRTRPVYLFRTMTAAVCAAIMLVALSATGALAVPSRSAGWTDDFGSPTFDTRWSWVREDSTHWNLTERPGLLRIKTQEGTLYQGTNTTKNVLLQPAPAGDFEIQTRVLFAPTENIQTAGLIIYQDDDNYLALIRGFCGFGPPCAGNALYFDHEEQGQTMGSTFGAAEIAADFDFFSLTPQPHRVLLPLIVKQEAPPALAYRLVPDSGACVPNAGVAYYNGVVRDRAGELQNGVCVHVAFFGPRNTKCSGCDGVGNGNWGFAPFGGPAPANIPVEIFIVPCPAYLPPGGQSSDFGDLTPLSDKWLFTTSSTNMQCTGITFIQN